jgi:hypothetical protein
MINNKASMRRYSFPRPRLTGLPSQVAPKAPITKDYTVSGDAEGAETMARMLEATGSDELSLYPDNGLQLVIFHHASISRGRFSRRP